MNKLFLLVLVALLGSVVPFEAIAQTYQLNPNNGNTWDLYVYGNGLVIQRIFQGVSLLMLGDGSFTTLLFMLATFGFLVLAIAAGFDPGKNLRRMFTYILVVWMVAFGTTRVTANIQIIDLVAENSLTTNDQPYFLAERVPALVALPAVVTTQVGHHFTSIVDTFFSTVNDAYDPGFSMQGGQFNLFNRMIEESDQYVFRSPEIKNSLSAYVANCAIPAMAQGRLQGPGPSSEPVILGERALRESTNIMEVFASARHLSIMTQYYPTSASMSNVSSVATELGGTPITDSMRTRGIVMSCDSAFRLIEQDIQRDAEALLEAGNEAWAKTGVFVNYATAMNTALTQAAACGSASSGFSCAHGFIQQQAMLNTMRGAFRAAAVQTGNVELMQAASLSQGEQMQKSAWVAGFAIFNNMMGYVFTVLQSFIFALTPLIVVAMLIPGMGKTIFVNYAQVLVWLTLWPPMFAIINFIITVYGSSEFSEAIGAAGGLTGSNKGLISERANDSVIAAQFLGTMVPLLTWGIVKGAMAFTEFISNGVGSAFASQAGASAATGNLSMNNLSMNNTSANKFDSVMSSAIGSQAVALNHGGGSIGARFNAGGSGMTANEAQVDMSQQLQSAAQRGISFNRGVASEISAMISEGTSTQQLLSQAGDSSKGSTQQVAAQRVLSQQLAASMGSGAGVSEAANAIVSQATSAAVEAGMQARNTAGGSASLGISKFGTGASMSTGYERASTDSSNAAVQAAQQEAFARTLQSELVKFGMSESNARQVSDSFMSASTTSRSASERGSIDQSASLQQAKTDALRATEQYSETLSQSQTLAGSMGFKSAVDMQIFNNMMDTLSSYQTAMPSENGLRSQMAAMDSSLSARTADYGQDFTQTSAALTAATGNLRAGAGGLYQGAATSNVESNIANTGANIEAIQTGTASTGRATATAAQGTQSAVTGAAVQENVYTADVLKLKPGEDGRLGVTDTGSAVDNVRNAAPSRGGQMGRARRE